MRSLQMRAFTGLGLIVLTAVLAVPLAARMQDPTEGELRHLADAYAQAWAKGDGKALAALYTNECIRFGQDGKISVGRARIEQALTEALVGPYRGSKITVTYGQTTRATQDSYVTEGTFLISGGIPPAGTPTRGRYLQTIVRINSRWLIAGDAALGPPRPAK
jgi:uncharacterized protein (TIGR02246 family)